MPSSWTTSRALAQPTCRYATQQAGRGRRRSICITNNEVACRGAERAAGQRLRSGYSEWEYWGICEYITKPRIRPRITGETPDGQPIKGDYKFTTGSRWRTGSRNVEFFTLTYEAPHAWRAIASSPRSRRCCGFRLARAAGALTTSPPAGMSPTPTACSPTSTTRRTSSRQSRQDDVTIAYIVTDEDRLFESVAQELPDHVEPVRLYEA